MCENEKTVRKTYALPSRIVSRDEDGETVCTLTYTPREDASCELLCSGDDGLQVWFLCDAHGNVTERIKREADGTISHHFERKVDEQGNLTDMIYFDSDGQITMRFEHRYDADGNETERRQYDREQLQSRLVYENNAQGKLRRMTEYDHSGIVRQQVKWEYDEHGRETKRTEFDGDEHIEEVVLSAYGEGENGTRWEEYTLYGADGGIVNRTLEEYDADDRMTRITAFGADDSVLESQEYLYGADGELSEDIDRGSEGCVTARTVYERGEGGKTEKQTRFDADGNTEDITVSIYENGIKDGENKYLRLTAQTVYDPDGNVLRQAKITDNCEAILTEAQYETLRWFCGGILDI